MGGRRPSQRLPFHMYMYYVWCGSDEIAPRGSICTTLDSFGFTILGMHAIHHDILISCMQEVCATSSQPAGVVYGLQWPLNYLKDLIVQEIYQESCLNQWLLKMLNLVMIYHCRLLFKWYQDHIISASFFFFFLNAAVFNQVIQVDVSSNELVQKVCQRAGPVYR